MRGKRGKRKTLSRVRKTYHSVDELDVPRALTIAVARAKLRTRLVHREPFHSTIFIHGHKVQRAIQTASQLRDIHIKRKLIAQQRKHLIPALIFHQVQPATHVLAIRALLHEFHAQSIPGGGHAVCAGIVGAVDAAVLRAGLLGGADGCVPAVAGVAVLGAVDAVRPAPVGVDGDGALDGLAA